MSKVTRRALLECLQADLCLFNSVDKKSPFVDEKSVAATLLLESVFKKFEDPNPKADAKAIDKFLSVNERMGSYKLVAQSSWDDEIVGMVKTILDNFLHPSGMPLVDSFKQLFMAGETGPGASIGGRGGDFYTKMFSSGLSTSDLTLYNVYRADISDLTSWSAAEKHRFTNCNGPKLVEGNRLSCVPKNVDISRTICTEPTLNMWYQLGLGNVLRERLDRFFGINLAFVADINRKLAYQSSLDCPRGSASFSTIDLESASDSISLELVDSLFPKWFSDLLRYLRSPVSRLPSGITLPLNMVSTMGNGFTFPLQTLLFSAVVSAVYKQMGIPRLRVDSDAPNWSVFGDDIVVRSDAFDRVVHCLAMFGFVVNADKSFKEGPFRESCGCDYFRGHMVRGVYLKRLELPQDIYVAFNKFVRWSARNKIALCSTLRYLLKKARFNAVPFWEADDAGFKVPEYWPWFNARRVAGGWAYKPFIRRTPIMRLTEDRILLPRSLRNRTYNPDGLLISITRGDWTDGFQTARHSGMRSFVQVRRVTSSWIDPPVSLDNFVSISGYQRWYQDLRTELAFGRAIAPVAGAVEGRQCESVFQSLFK